MYNDPSGYFAGIIGEGIGNAGKGILRNVMNRISVAMCELGMSGIIYVKGSRGSVGFKVGKNGKKTAGKGGSETKPFDIVEYSDKTPGIENHHGVLDVWATNNINGYKSRDRKSTTIALTKEQQRQYTEIGFMKRLEKSWRKNRLGKDYT